MLLYVVIYSWQVMDDTNDPLAQSAEHLPFKQGVRGSNPRRVTKENPATTTVAGFRIGITPKVKTGILVILGVKNEFLGVNSGVRNLSLSLPRMVILVHITLDVYILLVGNRTLPQ